MYLWFGKPLDGINFLPVGEYSDWQIAVDSSRKRHFNSSRAALGLAPSSQPRY